MNWLLEIAAASINGARRPIEAAKRRGNVTISFLSEQRLLKDIDFCGRFRVCCIMSGLGSSLDYLLVVNLVD